MSKVKSEKKQKVQKEDLFKHFPIEPLMENRFIIETEGVEIPYALFRSYKLYNESENYIFETKFIETVGYQFDPKDFLNIVGVTVKYLDVAGELINGLYLPVKGSNFKVKSAYKKDGFQTVKMRFVVEPQKIKLLQIKRTSDD